MTLDRRNATRLLAKAGLFAATAATFGAGNILTSSPARSQEASVDVGELMKPGPLEEMSLGSADAPVTIVEYMSLTCSHCAAFHKSTYPALKTKYIEAGKVRFVLREFPLDQLAWAGFMIIRCADSSKFFPLVEVLMDKQDTWARSNDPAGELFKIVKQAGMTKDQFDACLQNKELAQNVLSVKQRGESEFKVDSTPTFFINGKLLSGAQPIEEFDKMIEPLL